MSFSQSFIEKVRESVNIVDLIGQFTELKRTGGRFFGLCPFPDHNEKTASFSVTEDRQLYHCFGCGKGGTVFTFLQNYRGLNFPEAVEFLADRAGIELEREEYKGADAKAAEFQRDVRQKNKDERKNWLKLNKLAADFFVHTAKKLPAGHPHRAYFERRKLTSDLVEKFQLGIASDQWQGLTDVLEKRKVPFASGEKLGLVKKKKQGDGYFDMFRDRLIFPILSPSGDVLGFGGRTFGEDHPKYLNSPETPVFNKGKTLYGLHETAKFIRTADAVIIVEGYMDLLALYSAGICNVVAVLGTALTEHHAKLIKRYTKNVLVLFDGDAAGKRAAERSLSILLSQGLFPREVCLEDGQDPDDYLNNHGVEALQKNLQEAPEFYMSFLDRCCKEFGSASTGKVRTVDRIAPVLKAVADVRLRELYFGETVERLGVTAAWLRKSLQTEAARPGAFLNSQANQQVEPRDSSENQPSSAVSGSFVARSGDERKLWKIKDLAKAELQLLQVGLQSQEHWELVEKADLVDEMSPTASAIFSWLQGEYRQNRSGFDKLPALLASKVDLPNFVTVTMTSTLSTDGDSENDRSSRLIEDCLKWIHGRYLRVKAKEATLDLKGQPSAKQLEQFMNVQKRKRSVLRK